MSKYEKDNNQKGGKKMADCYGRNLGMGIPSYDDEPMKAKLVPLKNKFSAHEMSQEETLRAVKGRGSSSHSEK